MGNIDATWILVRFELCREVSRMCMILEVRRACWELVSLDKQSSSLVVLSSSLDKQ